MKEIISTKSAPQAIGPYSQAVRAGEFLFVSGQLPLDPSTMEIETLTVSEQAEAVLKNIQAILKTAGMTMEQVVKTTILLVNIKDFAAVNEVYAKFFREDPPARATCQVAALPKNALIEIEAVAYKG